MKKRYFLSNMKFGTFFFFLFFILFGCMEEDNFPLNEKGNDRLSAIIIEKTTGTRTTLSDNPTNQKVEVKWNAEDAIGVFGSSSGSNVRYQTNESFISEDGKSTVFETTATAAEGDLTVYYPYQQGAAISQQGLLQLTMPGTQSYYTERTGIVQPDPATNMMAGKGKDGTIAFRNLFAILRINIAGSDGQVVKEVLFTDLSGRPVSGSFSVSWSGDIPTAKFPDTGSGHDLQIELDCGDGVELGSNSLAKFFMIVPARNYSKGFRVEFVLASGDKITKTIGSSGGKILLRNMLYPVGDMFPNQDDKVSYKLNEKASVMDDERYELISKASLDTTSYELTLTVDAGFAPVKDEIIIINHVSTTLPVGYVGRVKTIGGSTVKLEPVKDITEVFEELSIGGPLWSSGGDAIAGGGFAIDLSQYITSIETPDGKPVDFALDGSSLYMDVPLTRAEVELDTKFSLPKLSHNFERINQENNPNNSAGLTIGVQMDMAMYFHILTTRLTLNDLQCRFDPTINVSFDFNVDWVTADGAYEKRIPFIVVNVTPIPVGPIIICPKIQFELIFSLDGKVGFSAEITYSEDFTVGMTYQNSVMNSYGNVVQKEAGKSPWGFNPKVRLEGYLGFGVAPVVEFSLWKLISINTRLNTIVKGGANLNFNLSSPFFDPSLYNAFCDSKFSSHLEMYMDGGVYVWSEKISDAKSTKLEYPLWEAYFVPKLENFVVSATKDKIKVGLDISNKLFFDSEIGMNFYEKDEKTGKFTVEAGSMKLSDYSKPPVGKDKLSLKLEEGSNLPSGKEYEARLTVALDVMDELYTLETDVKTRFIILDVAITLTTTKKTGDIITLQIEAKPENSDDVWIDLNNNGKQDDGEKAKINAYAYFDYRLKSQTISIYGNITKFGCGDNQVTTLDASGCKTLEKLECRNNQLSTLNLTDCVALEVLDCRNNYNYLTSLDLSSCTGLKHLLCEYNKLSSLDLSGYKALKIISSYNNQLTSLNVSGCVALNKLDCSENQLTTLNVSGCTSLEELDCYMNQLTSLNVSSFKALKKLECHYNQLISLDVSGCSALEYLDCVKNGLLGIRPAIFDNIEILGYDIRYEYMWDNQEKRYVVRLDTEKGYWYAHEPGGGCHSPEPCN